MVEPQSSPEGGVRGGDGSGSRISHRRSLAKAVSWRVIGSLDTLVLSFLILTFLGPFLGLAENSTVDNARTASYIAVTETATKIMLYYIHERLWARARWGMQAFAGNPDKDTRSRSIIKTMSWRALATLDTMLLALIYTGSFGAALSIAGFEFLTKLALYYLHERAWEQINWR